ncbi:hypothetical protein [Paraburkholderia xenovorans]|uniref:hypothetical protein n=1 Tax=Paraburkholderia xenovorans TaxID=36873 RepID=UPI0038B836CA
MTTPIVFGMTLQRTHNFHYAMQCVPIVAVLGIPSYIFLVGKIEMIVPSKKREPNAYGVTQSSQAQTGWPTLAAPKKRKRRLM